MKLNFRLIYARAYNEAQIVLEETLSTEIFISSHIRSSSKSKARGETFAIKTCFVSKALLSVRRESSSIIIKSL